jgi:hypothetical protein
MDKYDTLLCFVLLGITAMGKLQHPPSRKPVLVLSGYRDCFPIRSKGLPIPNTTCLVDYRHQTNGVTATTALFTPELGVTGS